MQKINKILFITLSNIGDCLLSLPALDYLRESFVDSFITVMAGPRAKDIFENNPAIHQLIIFDKHSGLKEKIALFHKLKREKFDVVVDLRNSFFGLMLPAKFKTSPFLRLPKYIKHMSQQHLYRVISALGKPASSLKNIQSKFFFSQVSDRVALDNLLSHSGINKDSKIIVVSAGARSHTKRWPKEKFVKLTSLLIEDLKVRVVLVGDKNDLTVNKYITDNLKNPILDLTGCTDIAQLACVVKKANLVVTNDSAVLHMAGYLNTPTVAIFGPTDEGKYGPWSDVSIVIKKDLFCRPCEEAQCRFATPKCLGVIKVEDVLRGVRDILVPSTEYRVPSIFAFQRILIIRTDRVGDVLLSTPVIKAIRETYPQAYIAMMVGPYAKEIIEGNPYLDEVIIYDKDNRHKGWLSSVKFSFLLSKRKFELAVILHPTNRVHLVTFFAGIPRRLGYDRKFGFLLTDRVKHTKQLGQKHELEYSLDLLGHLGIKGQDKNIFIPIKAESEKWVEDLFDQEKIDKLDRLLAIHPGASCPSKIWPQERFAQATDRLIDEHGFKVLIIAGPKDIAYAKVVARNMRHAVIDLSGKTSISQLASVLKRCRLFISNDSGPVHIASAVGTPVISIFGRNQKGLSPKRWGPVGKKDRVLHKEVGCIYCLAHNCVKEFACLKAITVEDVVNVADSILKE
ncbi:MAG: lipopolysaccharide heptosyltransferase II [Omnitrophica WOR_2 bacterium RBG_13_41_10]|nr:MAG: lipopolysaccharide heptosyltransferase II [Omnitrophica WOR_2 bacterium RBG_13_41_10]